MAEFNQEMDGTNNMEGEQDVSMPLGTGEFEGGMSDGPFGAGASKRKIGSGTLVLGLVVVLAAVGLYSMRSLAIAKAGTVQKDKSLEDTIEGFLSSLTGEGRNGSSDVTVPDVDDTSAGDVLVDDRTEKQVTINNVAKNPFAYPFARETSDGQPVIDPNDPGAELEARLAAQRDEKRVTCEMAAAKLRLLMLMGGNRPMVNISGRVLHEGDTVYDDRLDIEFTVQRIDHSAVTLVVEDPSIDFVFETVLRLSPN